MTRSWLFVMIGLGVVLVVGLVVVVLRGSGSTNPGRLAVGDCFDLPQATDRIGDLRRRSCNGPHGGEVFHIFDTPGLASPGYPSDAAWETLVYPDCDPAFEGYTGTFIAERLDIEYRYFVPTADRWASGERQVTCYITAPDGAPLSRSFRAAPLTP
jgi:hypothetical protein